MLDANPDALTLSAPAPTAAVDCASIAATEGGILSCSSCRPNC